MFRFLLSACLVVSTLLGPMMCCCALQASASPAISEGRTETSPVKLRHKSCCESETPTKDQSKLPSPNPGCPCKKLQLDQGLVTLPNPIGGSFADSHRLPVGVIGDIEFRLMTVHTQTLYRVLHRDQDKLIRSGRDILTAHHVLTC